MAMSPGSLEKLIVARQLPTANADNPHVDVPLRGGRYGDTKTESVFPTDHLQADEGVLFSASMSPGATALQLGLSAAFSATAAAIVIVNTDVAGGKRIYPKKLKLMQSVAPTSGIDLRYAIVLDSINRQPTTVALPAGSAFGPGTPATATAYRSPVVGCNQDTGVASIAAVYFPLSAAAGAPPTIPAASGQSRIIEGNGYLKNSIPVVKDQYVLQFGSADVGGTFQGAAALAKIVEHVSAVCIGPGQTLTIHLWSAGNITAGNAWDGMTLELVER